MRNLVKERNKRINDTPEVGRELRAVISNFIPQVFADSGIG